MKTYKLVEKSLVSVAIRPMAFTALDQDEQNLFKNMQEVVLSNGTTEGIQWHAKLIEACHKVVAYEKQQQEQAKEAAKHRDVKINYGPNHPLYVKKGRKPGRKIADYVPDAAAVAKAHLGMATV